MLFWIETQERQTERIAFHLCVNDHGADKEVKDPAESAKVVGHGASNIGENSGVIHDVHKHEREINTFSVAIDREEHENDVVAEEGLRDQDIVPNAKQPGACRVVSNEEILKSGQCGC